MRRYKKVKAKDKSGWSEWQQPITRGYKLVCCDCALVHHMEFRIYRGKIQFRAARADRLTVQLRKREGITCKT